MLRIGDKKRIQGVVKSTRNREISEATSQVRASEASNEARELYKYATDATNVALIKAAASAITQIIIPGEIVDL